MGNPFGSLWKWGPPLGTPLGSRWGPLLDPLGDPFSGEGGGRSSVRPWTESEVEFRPWTMDGILGRNNFVHGRNLRSEFRPWTMDGRRPISRACQIPSMDVIIPSMDEIFSSMDGICPSMDGMIPSMDGIFRPWTEFLHLDGILKGTKMVPKMIT